MLNNKTKICLASLVVVFLFSCSSAGRKFDTGPIRNIRRGETSEADIRVWFGDPLYKETTPSGAVWHYVYQKSSITPKTLCLNWIGMYEMKSYSSKLDVVFNKEGIVSDYSFSEGERTHEGIR